MRGFGMGMALRSGMALGMLWMVLGVACSDDEATPEDPGCSQDSRDREGFILGVPSDLDGGVACTIADYAGYYEAVTDTWQDANQCELTGSDEWSADDCTLTRTVICEGGLRRVTGTTTAANINGRLAFEGELIVENLDADGETWLTDDPCLVRVTDESGTVSFAGR